VLTARRASPTLPHLRDGKPPTLSRPRQAVAGAHGNVVVCASRFGEPVAQVRHADADHDLGVFERDCPEVVAREEALPAAEHDRRDVDRQLVERADLEAQADGPRRRDRDVLRRLRQPHADRGRSRPLAVEGLSNPEIGAKLFMARSTVKTPLCPMPSPRSASPTGPS
jgi:hypothetical protein